jgi:hypothetical protein
MVRCVPWYRVIGSLQMHSLGSVPRRVKLHSHFSAQLSRECEATLLTPSLCFRVGTSVLTLIPPYELTRCGASVVHVIPYESGLCEWEIVPSHVTASCTSLIMYKQIINSHHAEKSHRCISWSCGMFMTVIRMQGSIFLSQPHHVGGLRFQVSMSR